MITKDQLVAKRGKRRGTLVRVPHDVRKWMKTYDDAGELVPTGNYWTLEAGEYEVCDLFDRKSYSRPDAVGIIWFGGLATSVELANIEPVGCEVCYEPRIDAGHKDTPRHQHRQAEAWDAEQAEGWQVTTDVGRVIDDEEETR